MTKGQYGQSSSKPDNMGHVTRYSDSSQNNEVFIHCGTTDGRNSKLHMPCPIIQVAVRNYE
jgi:hypothetical protein